MKIEKRKNRTILDIQDSIVIKQKGHKIILEPGDRVEVINENKLEESVMTVGPRTISDVVTVMRMASKYVPAVDKAFNAANRSIGVFNHLVILNRQSFDKKYDGKEDDDANYLEIAKAMATRNSKPETNSFVQLFKSLDCYLYQIEGKIAGHPTIKALEEIKKYIPNIMHEHPEYDDGYWGD